MKEAKMGVPVGYGILADCPKTSFLMLQTFGFIGFCRKLSNVQTGIVGHASTGKRLPSSQ